MHAVYTGDVYDGRFSLSADINGDIRRVVQIDCLICGEPFLSRLDNLKRGKGLTCSRSCAGTLGARNRNKKYGLTGESNPNWRGGVSANPYRYKKRQMDRYPEKVKARKKVYHALQSGKLERQSCENCGSTESVQAHHENYARPLDVAWLCSDCHRQQHQTK
jgi:ribosomal protein S27AE